MSNIKMENKLITREIIILINQFGLLSGKYTLTVPTLIKHVSVPSYEP